jgi:hypothetical protein
MRSESVGTLDSTVPGFARALAQDVGCWLRQMPMGQLSAIQPTADGDRRQLERQRQRRRANIRRTCNSSSVSAAE